MVRSCVDIPNSKAVMNRYQTEKAERMQMQFGYRHSGVPRSRGRAEHGNGRWWSFYFPRSKSRVGIFRRLKFYSSRLAFLGDFEACLTGVGY